MAKHPEMAESSMIAGEPPVWRGAKKAHCRFPPRSSADRLDPSRSDRPKRSEAHHGARKPGYAPMFVGRAR